MTEQSITILNTPLLLTDYAKLQATCRDLATRRSCVAIEFTNTQIVTMRRWSHAFRVNTNAFDLFVPDGMPLVWCANAAGAKLADRVYGPTFMRSFLVGLSGGESTHYLLGGSSQCGERLRSTFKDLNPSLRFVGGFHGTCGPDGILEGDADEEVVSEINRLSPDYIWVGLGAPKQELWIERHKHLISRGVILSVGFAFDVNAGLKADAPPWMQRHGLTWLYRLCAEPRRLALRYLKYNSLFLGYLLLDGVRLRAWRLEPVSLSP